MTQTSRPRVVSLFSGIGATDLALEHLGCETVAHSDVEPFTLDVFAKRFPRSVSIGSVVDVLEVPVCEVMAGGFPCQDISNAGPRIGIGGKRSGLWKEFFRLITLSCPRVVLIENVSVLLSRGIDVVVADLASIGYAVEWDCIPAAAVGAPHQRDRIWMVAYAEDEPVVREDRLERPLTTLTHPPSKWPRAGRMCQGAVLVREPIAPRKTKRLNPGSAWVGVELDRRNGWWHGPLWPTTQATMADRGGRGDLLQAVRGNASPSGHFSFPLYPTPCARDWKDSAGMTGRGYLNARWVEWLMGFPLGWTDLGCDDTSWHGWNFEPVDTPRVTVGSVDRTSRLRALGNAQVPQVMRYWAAPAIERLR